MNKTIIKVVRSGERRLHVVCSALRRRNLARNGQLFFLLMVFVLLALPGCRPDWPRCENDEHCQDDGHTGYCVNGQCQECRNDGDCPAGQECLGYRCVARPECLADGDCGQCQACRGFKCLPECQTASDCPAGARCDNGCCAEGAAPDEPDNEQEVFQCELAPVYFDFDEAAIKPDARPALHAAAACLKKQPALAVVEGHCDERGTTEYNLALGDRRARTTRSYLQNLGVGEALLGLVSYGEERPACDASSEACWARNRRAEFRRK